MSNYKINTKCVQGGYTPGNGEPRQIPIIQSTTFKYATSEDMGKLFDLEAEGYFYSRLQNPTNDFVAEKICAMEGGVAAMLTSSGQSANFYAIFNICEAGDHFITSSSIYGGTYNLFNVSLRKMGIECTFVDQNLPEEELEIIENSSRFSFFNRVKHIGKLSNRAMNGKAIIYPYWENVARATEDRLAVLMIFQLLFLAIPVIVISVTYLVGNTDMYDKRQNGVYCFFDYFFLKEVNT